LTVRKKDGTIKKNGRSITITDQDTLEEIRSEIDAVTDELIRNVLDQKELTELNTLIKKFEHELS
jgi:gas vesicle protein